MAASGYLGATPYGREATFPEYMVLWWRGDPGINRVLLGRIKKWGGAEKWMLDRQSTVLDLNQD